MSVKIEVQAAGIPGGHSANVQAICEWGPFRLRKILIPDDVAEHFMVTDVKVGKNSQLYSPGAVPASFFGEAREGRQEGLYFDRLPRGAHATLSVTCTALPPPPPPPPEPCRRRPSRRLPSRRLPSRRRPWWSRVCDYLLGPEVLGTSLDEGSPAEGSVLQPKIFDSKTFAATLVGDVEGDTSEDEIEGGRARRIVLGLGSTLVPFNSSANIMVQASCSCELDTLYVPESVLEAGLRVRSVRVVGEDVLSPPPTEPSSSQTDPPHEWDSVRALTRRLARPGDWVVVSVQNVGGHYANFQGVLVGALTVRGPS